MGFVLKSNKTLGTQNFKGPQFWDLEFRGTSVLGHRISKDLSFGTQNLEGPQIWGHRIFRALPHTPIFTRFLRSLTLPHILGILGYSVDTFHVVPIFRHSAPRYPHVMVP